MTPHRQLVWRVRGKLSGHPELNKLDCPVTGMKKKRAESALCRRCLPRLIGPSPLISILLKELAEALYFAGGEVPGGAGENARHVAKGVADVHPLMINGELADLFVVH